MVDATHSTSGSALGERRQHVRHLDKQDFTPEEEEAFNQFLDDYVDALTPIEEDLDEWLRNASEEDLESLESIQSDLQQLIADGGYVDDFEEVFQEGGERATQAGRQLASRRYNLDIDPFDVVPDQALEVIDDWVDEAAGSTLETIDENAARWLRGAHEDGLSIPEIQEQINDELFDSRLESHVAERAARTGTNSTSNLGVHTSFQESDMVVGEEWIAIGDKRTRDDHNQANGQIVAVGTPFSVGGEKLDHPGDPSGSLEQIVNCRCTMVPVFEDDLSDEELEAIEAGERIRKAFVDETVKLAPDGTTEPLVAA